MDHYKHGLVSLSPKMKMEHVAAGLSDFKSIPFVPSVFVKPASVTFNQSNGTDSRLRKWDYIEAHDSIAVLLYDKEMHSVLMVRQFRPTVYARALRHAQKSNLPEPSFVAGFTYELCAGLVDKDKSLVEIAHEEIMEECGYDVPTSLITEVTQFVSAIGTEGTNQTLFFAEVNSNMRQSGGGGVEHDGEAIELLALPFDRMDDFLNDTSLPKSTGLMFAFKWLQEKLRR